MTKVVFDKMCDRCFRMLADNEKMYAFKFIDDENKEKVFKGHEGCLNEMVDVMQQLYGTKENTDNE